MFTCIFIVTFLRAQSPLGDTASKGYTASDLKVPASTYKKQLSEIVKNMVSHKQFISLSYDKFITRCKIQKDSPEVDLPPGPSRIVLIKLPAYTPGYSLKIISWSHGISFNAQIFSPSGIFFDSTCWPTRLLSEKEFLLSSEGGASMVTEVPLTERRKSEQYLLIYTLPEKKRIATLDHAKNGALLNLRHKVESSPYGKLDLILTRL